MFMISDSQLQQIMPNLPASQRQIYLPFLNRVMEIYGANTSLRIAAFLAQVAHESGELRYFEEIWGPTAQQQRYEPPSDLATRLGNTQPGDGYRYRGRGPIQITGRYNYRKYGQLLGIDLESIPDLAKSVQIAFSIAGLFWQNNGLNQLADAGNFVEITRRINGGLNGLQNRQKYYDRAKSVLGVRSGFRSAGRSIKVETTINSPAKPAKSEVILPRGQEAIEEDAARHPLPTPAKKRRKKMPAKKSAKKSAKQTVTKKAPAKKAAKKPVKSASKKAPKKAAKKVAKKATTRKK